MKKLRIITLFNDETIKNIQEFDTIVKANGHLSNAASNAIREALDIAALINGKVLLHYLKED